MRCGAARPVLRHQADGQTQPQRVRALAPTIGNDRHVELPRALDQPVDFLGRDLRGIGRHDEHRRSTLRGQLRLCETHCRVQARAVIVQHIDALRQRQLLVGRHHDDAIDTTGSAQRRQHPAQHRVDERRAARRREHARETRFTLAEDAYRNDRNGHARLRARERESAVASSKAAAATRSRSASVLISVSVQSTGMASASACAASA